MAALAAASSTASVSNSPYETPDIPITVTNGTDSPQFSCRSGGFLTVDTPTAYCGVPGGAKRMGACCAALNNGNGTLYLHGDQPGDCFVWCHVDIDSILGRNRRITLLGDFAQCLEEDQGYTVNAGCHVPQDVPDSLSPDVMTSSTRVTSFVTPTALATSRPSAAPNSSRNSTSTTRLTNTATITPSATPTPPPSQAGLSFVGQSAKAIVGLLAVQIVFAAMM